MAETLGLERPRSGRDELLDVELFSCPAEAQGVIEDCRHDSNHHRPRRDALPRSLRVKAG